MLFRKSIQALAELNTKVAFLQNEMQLLREELKKCLPTVESVSSLSALTDTVKQVEKQIQRQSTSFEDLLDEFQDQRSHWDEDSRHKKERNQREQALLAWAVLERDQLSLLRNAFLGDSSLSEERKSAWATQFSMMEDDGVKRMALCDVQEFGAEGASFDTGLYEVLDVWSAPEQAFDGKIARLYSPGLLYGGKLLRKAKAAVYRWKGEDMTQTAATENE